MKKKIGNIAFSTGMCLMMSCATAGNLASKDELYEGAEYKKAFSQPKDNPDLPNVLLIGDSISIGYTVDVRKLLKGKADVFRIKGNGRDSNFGVKKIKALIGNKKWDVIHFNWGLWDLCYRNPKSKMQGHRDKINGQLSTTPEQYRKNIEKIIAVLKKTGAKLIWCTTTPVPPNEAGRKEGDAAKYNAIVADIMVENNIMINDLYTYTLPKAPEIRKKDGDVHFKPEGYKFLAKKVAKEIIKSLK